MNEKPSRWQPIFGPKGPSLRQFFFAGVAFGLGLMLMVFIGAGLAAIIRWLIS